MYFFSHFKFRKILRCLDHFHMIVRQNDWQYAGSYKISNNRPLLYNSVNYTPTYMLTCRKFQQ